MKAANTKIQNNSNDTIRDGSAGAPVDGGTVEVLYQKMGGRWYAFSVVEGEVFMGAVPDEAIHDAELASSKVHKISGAA